MILVTGCNKPYFNRMTPYLDSLRIHADFPVYLVGVGFEPPAMDGICTVSISQDENAGAPRETESIQHGSFASFINAPSDEVLMYTDGDFIMQRGLNDLERATLQLKHFQAITSWNGGPHETLKTEAGRLGQQMNDSDITKRAGGAWQHLPIYNAGLLVMTKSTWELFHSVYLHWWDWVCEAFSHQARQQWLISFLLSSLRYDVVVAPWHFHAHGHFGLKPGMERRADGIYADGKKALFRHYI